MLPNDGIEPGRGSDDDTRIRGVKDQIASCYENLSRTRNHGGGVICRG
jgi:hypothetical protein